MLHLLPTRSGGAAENMAIDFLLLQRYPEPEAARFRHYGWRMPAITFGYSQKWENVEAEAPADREFCRRPTGGGIVDHTDDWTYSLVVPRAHELCNEPAPLVYYLIHRMLCDIFVDQGQNVQLQQESAEKTEKTGVCFTSPEPHDIVEQSTGAKVAGAALKRTKNGLLIQGSVSRKSIRDLDWNRFETDLHLRLAETLSCSGEVHPWPDFDPDHEMHLIDQFSSPEWNERR